MLESKDLTRMNKLNWKLETSMDGERVNILYDVIIVDKHTDEFVIENIRVEKDTKRIDWTPSNSDIDMLKLNVLRILNCDKERVYSLVNTKADRAKS